MEQSTSLIIILSVISACILLLLLYFFYSHIYNFFVAGSKTIRCPLNAKNRTWQLPPGAATIRVTNRMSPSEDTSCCCSMYHFSRCTSQYLYDCVTCYDFPHENTPPSWLQKTENGLRLNVTPRRSDDAYDYDYDDQNINNLFDMNQNNNSDKNK